MQDERAAVPRAVGRTSALITTAGAILTFVFLGFSVSDETAVPMIGFGLATALLDDVTVLLLFLAPALLELGGERAWWMLAWLSRRRGPTSRWPNEFMHPAAIGACVIMGVVTQSPSGPRGAAVAGDTPQVDRPAIGARRSTVA